MAGHTFQYSGERTSYGELKNSCLRCGRTKESHTAPLETNTPKLGIWFNGKIFWFKDKEEARKYNFFIGEY